MPFNRDCLSLSFVGVNETLSWLLQSFLHTCECHSALTTSIYPLLGVNATQLWLLKSILCWVWIPLSFDYFSLFFAGCECHSVLTTSVYPLLGVKCHLASTASVCLVPHPHTYSFHYISTFVATSPCTGWVCLSVSNNDGGPVPASRYRCRLAPSLLPNRLSWLGARPGFQRLHSMGRCLARRLLRDAITISLLWVIDLQCRYVPEPVEKALSSRDLCGIIGYSLHVWFMAYCKQLI